MIRTVGKDGQKTFDRDSLEVEVRCFQSKSAKTRGLNLKMQKNMYKLKYTLTHEMHTLGPAIKAQEGRKAKER